MSNLNLVNSLKEQKKILLLIVMVLLTVILLYFFSQYKSSTSELSEISEPEIEIVAKDKEQLLKDFPDFPLYPNSQVKSSQHEVLGDQVTYYATLYTKENTQTVTNWYYDTFGNNDWEVQTNELTNGLIYAYKEGKTYIWDFGDTNSSETTYELKITWDED